MVIRKKRTETMQPQPDEGPDENFDVPAFLAKGRPADVVITDEVATEAAQAEASRATIGHNSENKELIAFVERLERLAEERQTLADDTKEVMAEIKGRGFDTGVLRKVLARRKMDPDKRHEMDMLVETYETALRMS